MRERPKITFIDDEQRILDGLRRLLRQENQSFEFRFTASPAELLAQVRDGQVDAIVSDIAMPEMNGLELLSAVRALPTGAHIPALFLSGHGDTAIRRQALDLDAIDLLNKPVEREELIARLRNMVRLKDYQDRLSDQAIALEGLVRERTVELDRSRREIVVRLALAGELRDEDTGDHVIRVGRYSYELALELALPAPFCETLLLAAPLHDVGKIGIRDGILLKPGRFTPNERAEMQRHCELGVRILSGTPRLVEALMGSLEGESGGANPLLNMASRIAGSHHERWDGGGYPSGLSGEDIPVEGRIVAVADVFDALLSKRPYKEPMPVSKAVAIVDGERGGHFDPAVVDAFHRALPRIQAIRTELEGDVVPAAQQPAAMVGAR